MAAKKSANKKKPTYQPHQQSQFGRPTKYDPKYCEDIISHMKQGNTLESFGAYLGEKYGNEAAVGKQVLYSWADQYQDFQDSIRVARAYAQKFYEDIGKSGITGNIKRVKSETPVIVDGKAVLGPDGRVVTKKEYEPATFNSGTFNFTMQNMFGWTRNVQHSGEIKGSNPVGDALSKILNDPKLASAAKSIAEKLVEDQE